MDQIISLITTVGFPIALIVFYLLVERPRSEKRFDSLIDKVVLGQEQCAKSIKDALDEHSKAIESLETLIEKKVI